MSQLTKEDRMGLDVACLWHVAQMPDIQPNRGMLIALVERRHNESRSFTYP